MSGLGTTFAVRGALFAALLTCNLYVAQGSSLTSLYSFTGPPTDGANPFGVTIGSGGVLYGPAFGGSANFGAVFSLAPPASPGGPWVESIFSFQGHQAGKDPVGVTAVGPVLYGVTCCGGTANEGTAFSLRPPASPGGAWSKRVLYNFQNGTDAADPGAPLTANNGVFYGTSQIGGLGNGTVFLLTPPVPPAVSWSEQVLYSFPSGVNETGPGPLTIGPVTGGLPTLFGNTFGAGYASCGTVFQLAPPAAPGGTWTETDLHVFTCGADGKAPLGRLTPGAGANHVLYGTTTSGGIGLGGGNGTVYSLTPPSSPGGPWVHQVLYKFAGGTDGADPVGGVVVGNNGVLYGTTFFGGTYNGGTIYSLTPSGSGPWTETRVYNFTGGSDGRSPNSDLVMGADGTLYGTTDYGGTNNLGTIFAFTP